MDKIFMVGVPYSGCEYKSELPCTREDEACAIAAGAVLAGIKAEVFMQESGFANTINVMCTLNMPYKIRVFGHISSRTEPEHHKYMAAMTRHIAEVLHETI